MLAMLGWIPIIGPIIDGIVSVIKGHQDVVIKKDTNDVEEIKARLQLLAALKDDIGVRLSRDLIMFPVAVWCAIATWDTIVAREHPHLMYVVEKFPPGPLEYLPLAVLGFLFGLQIRKFFK